MASLFKPSGTVYQRSDGSKCNKTEAVQRDDNGQPVMETYRTKRGKLKQREVLKKGYRRVPYKSPKYYARIRHADGRVSQTPD